MSGEGEALTLEGRLKEAVADLNDPPEKDGVAVDAVIEKVVRETEYTEADALPTLEGLILAGEVYPLGDGRVRVTP